MFLFDALNNDHKILTIPESLFMWRKSQERSAADHFNQSQLDYTNVYARKEILYHLRSRKDLIPEIKLLISDDSYVKNFLYKTILLDENTNDKNIQSLGLTKKDLNNYYNYSSTVNVKFVLLSSFFKRIIDYVYIFRFKGIMAIISLGFDRLAYKIRKKNIVDIISIVVPTYNESKYIDECIQSIKNFDIPKKIEIEIMIIDGQSTDNTRELIKKYLEKNIRLIDNPNRFQSYAMNIGIKQSKGNWILRLDAHSIYPKIICAIVMKLQLKPMLTMLEA